MPVHNKGQHRGWPLVSIVFPYRALHMRLLLAERWTDRTLDRLLLRCVKREAFTGRTLHACNPIEDPIPRIDASHDTASDNGSSRFDALAQVRAQLRILRQAFRDARMWLQGGYLRSTLDKAKLMRFKEIREAIVFNVAEHYLVAIHMY